MKFHLSFKVFSVFLSRLSKREKAVFYLATAAILLTIVDRAIINPIASKMDLVDKETQDKEMGIKRMSLMLAQKDRILSEKTKYANFFSQAQSEDEELTAILKEIENLANKSTVYLADMKPVGYKEIGQARKFIVSLNCEGQMEQIVDFMYNIESSNRMLRVERYEISQKSKDSSIAKCSMMVSKEFVK